MQVQQLLRIAGVGVLVTVISQILTRAGREDIATMTTIAGLVIVLMMVVTLVAELLSNVQSIFGLYEHGGFLANDRAGGAGRAFGRYA